tara:strand:+ start:17182 stop:18069 length:888 start_codon:yes stop_codon:yes gene_type:complete
MILRLALSSLLLLTCASKPATPEIDTKELPIKTVKSYWFGGKAEISSYELKQARYGEIHEGQSVLVYVTEPFSPSKLVKSDYSSESDVQVLKLNHTKKFTTGIYPYSIMTSSFLPIENGEHSLKITSSSQEWCGHTYMELQNKEKFEIAIHSYFEGESSLINLKKNLLEDDMWTKIRIKPEDLPTGKLKVIPSFFYLRLKHKETQAYFCDAKITEDKTTSTYEMNYVGLKRKVSITFENEFPYKILGWTESYPDGWAADSPMLTTEASVLNTIQSDYWNKNSVKDSELRKELRLN